MQISSKRRLKIPGPGAYNTDFRPVTPCPPAFSMGTKCISVTWPSTGQGAGGGDYDWEPGPGTYNASAHRTRCDGPAITMGPRTNASTSSALAIRSEAPGPGAYSTGKCVTLTRRRDPAYSIGSRNYTFHKDVSPGPGSYTPNIRLTSPAFSIATGRKADLMPGAMSAIPDTPGPGSYATNDHIKRPRTPVITISAAGSGRTAGAAQAAAAVIHSSPGPGAYNPHNHSPRGPAITISCRRKPRDVELSPGPGQYSAESAEAVIHPRDPMVSIGGKPRNSSSTTFCSVNTWTPGPGAYDPRVWNPTQHRAFTISGRPNQRRRQLPAEITPGPGSYFTENPSALPPLLYPSPPAIKIAEKHDKTTSSASPGPGAYSPRVERDTRAVTMASRKMTSMAAAASLQAGPGPGNYFNDNKYYTTTSSPSISMGVRFAAPKVAEVNPGPGAYSVVDRRHGPAFSMNSGAERYSF